MLTYLLDEVEKLSQMLWRMDQTQLRRIVLGYLNICLLKENSSKKYDLDASLSSEIKALLPPGCRVVGPERDVEGLPVGAAEANEGLLVGAAEAVKGLPVGAAEAVEVLVGATAAVCRAGDRDGTEDDGIGFAAENEKDFIAFQR